MSANRPTAAAVLAQIRRLTGGELAELLRRLPALSAELDPDGALVPKAEYDAARAALVGQITATAGYHQRNQELLREQAERGRPPDVRAKRWHVEAERLRGTGLTWPQIAAALARRRLATVTPGTVERTVKRRRAHRRRWEEWARTLDEDFENAVRQPQAAGPEAEADAMIRARLAGGG